MGGARTQRRRLLYCCSRLERSTDEEKLLSESNRCISAITLARDMLLCTESHDSAPRGDPRDSVDVAREERTRSVRIWQEHWALSDNGRWEPPIINGYRKMDSKGARRCKSARYATPRGPWGPWEHIRTVLFSTRRGGNVPNLSNDSRGCRTRVISLPVP